MKKKIQKFAPVVAEAPKELVKVVAPIVETVAEAPKPIVKKPIEPSSEVIAPHSWYGDDVILNQSENGVQLFVKPDYCLSNNGKIYNTAVESHFFKSKKEALDAWQAHQEGVMHQLFTDKASEPI
jgi:hypothetical protein